ncbi:hypothetical protein SASPL_116276 [Salvia splendens]|uniref:Transcriptional corepressor SEUSS n=1 Tax=Salvia splendens TaxID=180675 RepID=A0A8X8XVD6_SALSN|nr:hypothetical protein SASPL_116276 [Salvia splendens]
MVPQGPPPPHGGAQPVPPSLLRSNSSLLGGQGGGMPSQNAFPSLVSPRNQFNNMNMLGNVPNVSSLLHQSFGNGGSSSGLSGPGSFQQELVDGSPKSVSLSAMEKQWDSTLLFLAMRAGLGGVGHVKLEPQTTNEQASQQQLQALRTLSSVKMEPQQLQSMRSLGTVKMEPQQSDPSLFLHHQQQQQLQQQQLLLSRQSSQAVAAAQILHQQRLMQIQQQQQLLKAMPQQRSPLQQQFQPQNMPVRSPVKPVYEPGMCARRLTHYMYQQQHRPEDNSIEFWRKFVAEYFAPNAKKKWCVSMYGPGRQTTGVFPQVCWFYWSNDEFYLCLGYLNPTCDIIGSLNIVTRMFGIVKFAIASLVVDLVRTCLEATVEVLPRLFKIKYESGTIEELLYVDMPREYQNPAGQIVLDYAKAIQESVFEQLRVVRDGQLRIVFSPDLKICSWEFCARRHEELISRRLLIPQVSQLGTAAQKYQAATQNASTSASFSELQNNCNMFVSSARQLAKALEVPLVNDLGYTKRYVRCLQISEVVNSMKDLIDYSRETGSGPMESLAKFPRRTNHSPGFQGQQPPQPDSQLQQQQQQTGQNSNNDSSAAAAATLASAAGTPGVNNPANSATATASTSTIVGLLHQNSMNSRQQNPMSGINSPYGGNSVQMPSPGSANTMPQSQPPLSTFHSSTLPTSNNQQLASHGPLSGGHVNSVSSPNISMPQPTLSGDADANDSQSSVQKIIHDMMMSSQLGGGGMGMTGGDVKNVNGMFSTGSNGSVSGGNILVGTGVANGNPGTGVSGFGSMGNGLGQSAMVNGIRAALANNSLSMNGRVAMAMAREQGMNSQQQDMSNQLLAGGLSAVNGFNNLQFDWKASP